MKICILVDGQGEYYALPHLLPRLESPNIVLRPLFSAIQPLARPAQIAYVASKRAARNHLLSLSKTAEVRVVLKVTKLENWLVADPQALRDLPGLFEKEKVERVERQITPGRADTVDAHGLLKICSRKRAYDKKTGAIEICKKLDPERARKNSRSFRKLLKTLGCPEPPAETARGRGRRR